ncbi:MAG: hypothetical protein OSJ74_12125, partial [Clostridia bacterium]|nr:hypothetical protein [Clostridia bacterium]
MKIGVSTATYFSRFYTEDALERIARLGADVCEVFFASRCEYTAAFAEVLRARLEDARRIAPLN